jgi:hypothetical protein
MPLGTAFIAAAALAAAPAHSDAGAPVRIVCAAANGVLRVQVVGSSATPYEADYALEVISGRAGAENRSVSRGHVRLDAGAPVTLATVSAAAPAGRWLAKLEVTPASGPHYTQTRRPDDGGL